MSGPKVINLEAIRRRQQRESLAQLRTLQDSLTEWQLALERAGLLSAEALGAQQGILKELETLRGAENWQTILSEIPARIQFLRTAIDSAHENVIERQTALQTRRHRLAVTATMLLRELRATSRPAPAELERFVSFAPAHDEHRLDRIEAILNEVMTQLPAPTPQPTANIATQELSAALAAGTQGLTFQSWLTEHHNELMAGNLNPRIARAIAELQLHESGSPVAALIEKSRQLSVEPDSQRRAVLEDSLILEADALCRSIRERDQLTRLIREAIAAFEPFQSAEATAWVARLNAAFSMPEATTVRELIGSARKWLEQETAREDAQLRREAVLRALTTLGYEVRENMATAWAENGRIVIRRPADPDYGVELMTPKTGPAVQARVVAFAEGSERSSAALQRDREIEQTWCSQFQHMRDLLQADGFNPALISATPAGATPVKVLPAADHTRDVRSLPKPAKRRQRSGA